MDIAEVAQVHQVVMNQLIRRVVMVLAAAEPVLRIRMERVARRRAGRLGVRVGADPDPHDRVLLLHRIRRHARLGRNPVLPGNFHACTAAVEQQTVIAAAQAACFERAARQRQRLVAAAILQRTDFPDGSRNRTTGWPSSVRAMGLSVSSDDSAATHHRSTGNLAVLIDGRAGCAIDRLHCGGGPPRVGRVRLQIEYQQVGSRSRAAGHELVAGGFSSSVRYASR